MPEHHRGHKQRQAIIADYASSGLSREEFGRHRRRARRRHGALHDVDAAPVRLFHDVPIVYLHREPVDFRNAINSPVLIIEHEMALSPYAEALFVEETGMAQHGWNCSRSMSSTP